MTFICDSEEKEESIQQSIIFLVGWSFPDSSVECHFAGQSNKIFIEYHLCVSTMLGIQRKSKRYLRELVFVEGGKYNSINGPYLVASTKQLQGSIV